MSSGSMKRVMVQVQREAERQGAIVSRARGGGIRIKGTNGGVIVIHSSPSRPELYRQTLPKELLRAGIQPPEGGWKW